VQQLSLPLAPQLVRPGPPGRQLVGVDPESPPPLDPKPVSMTPPDPLPEPEPELLPGAPLLEVLPNPPPLDMLESP
jgi:hypothetical protein